LHYDRTNCTHGVGVVLWRAVLPQGTNAPSFLDDVD
jgi:hypothetical protein